MVLDRYIARAVLIGTAFAALIFGGLFLFMDFVRELKHIGEADYGALQAIYFVLLSMPQRLYELAPSIILIGGLISLGGMAINSELVAMRASGITPGRIIRSVLQAGMLVALAVAMLGEYVVPYAMSTGQTMRAKALDKRVLAGGAHGLWSRDGRYYINVRIVLPDMQLRDIRIYELGEGQVLKQAVQAKSARYEKGYWVLRKVKHSDISETGVVVSHRSKEVWSGLLRPELFDILRMDPEDMSAINLYQYANYLQKNDLDAKPFFLVFWIKVFTPFTCLVMLLIAMPLVFSATPRSGGIGQRVIIGLVLGIMFYVFNRAVNHLGVVYGLMPMYSAALPLVLVTMVALMLLRRIR